MKNIQRTPIILTACLSIVLFSCSDKSKQESNAINTERIVCLAKQQTEILFALDANDHLVGVDLSSTYPKEAQKIPNVGYHRLLNAEGIISLRPTVVFHDGNVAPEAAMLQVEKVGIPTKVFPKTSNIEDTKELIRSMAVVFGKEKNAEALCAKMDADMKMVAEKRKHYADTPKIVLLHFGRQMNIYLAVGQKSNASKIIEWAGGINSIEATEGMKPISAEMIVKSQPDVILITDFGYDRMGGIDKVKELPGIALTPAARNNKIYRVEEHDLIYLGPRTGEVVNLLMDLIHQ